MPFRNAMGNKQKSRIERLPKSERRHASSKIIVLPPPSPPEQDFASLSIVPRRASTLPKLDDDALAKVLSLAGPSSILSALRVCVQWRRVAKQLLADVVRLDLGRVYRDGECRTSPPSYAQVVRTVQQFPKLRNLVFQRWVYQDVMEDVADFVCMNYAGKMLEEVEFSAVLVSGTAIVQLLKNCAKVRSLKLGEHESVSDKLLNEVGSYCKQRRARDCEFQLQSVKISRSGCVTRSGVGVLLEHAGLSSLSVTKCNALQSVLWRPKGDQPMHTLNIASCPNLKRFLAIIQTGVKDVLELNLSQCVSLSSVEFRAGGVVGTEQPLCLRKLNLSGCRMLRELGLPSYEDSWASLENLEELNLFGAYSLPSHYFSTIFGLSMSECALPKLRRLDLNGCALDTLVLAGYQHLTHVNCSGCAQLRNVEIRESWNLENVLLLGKKIPLERVHMVLPANCIVADLRSQWQWESFESNQTIAFP